MRTTEQNEAIEKLAREMADKLGSFGADDLASNFVHAKCSTPDGVVVNVSLLHARPFWTFYRDAAAIALGLL